MKTVELFAGIGGFRLAAEQCLFPTVWANDFCPKASKVYRDRFGSDGFCEGDVRNLLDEIPSHDLLTAGFPCQPFSSAGKKQGIKDPRGTLFSVVVDVLQKHRPTYFTLENVKRLLTMESGVHFATILAALAELDYRIEWRLLNAADFGLPQNRQRVFITGVRSNASNQRNVVRLASKTDLDVKGLSFGRLHTPESWTDISSHGSRFPNWGLAEAGRFYGADLETFSAGQSQMTLQSVLQSKVAIEFDFTESTVERLKESKLVKRFVHGVEILSNQGGGARMGYTVFGINGLAPTLTSTASRHYERYAIDSRYRRLTNIEYARLQGFPDDHCSASSVYDQYALYGNAVPPPMAAWVLRQATSRGTAIPKRSTKRQQMSFFVDA